MPRLGRFTIGRLMGIIAVVAVTFGGVLQVRSWFLAWLTAHNRSQAIVSAEAFEAREPVEQAFAARFLDGAELARRSGEPYDALILQEAALACLRRAAFARETAAYWRFAEQTAPAWPTGAGTGRARAFASNADGRFAYEVALPILRHYDARTPTFDDSLRGR
ncbi:hypothetical protein [Tautonia marina]|uniref:hypothetical protein n=1 Tax=Tautonia marina TaxID=2653855 RepID=UPI00126046CC|nr:hypothetical protein [Tautonia marina]